MADTSAINTASRRAHAVLVLAAGGSRRLGASKLLLCRDGETMLRRATRLAAETCPSRLLVVLGADAEHHAAQLSGIEHVVVVNPAWSSGLASSLRAAAPLIGRFKQVLVLGCDQPALELAHLQELLRGAAAVTTGCAATGWPKGIVGAPAIVPGSWFAELATGPEVPAADHGFGKRLRTLQPEALHVVHAPDLGLDIDTPGDLQRARQAGLIDPAP